MRTWLTKPDSLMQARRRQIGPNRRKILPESGFWPPTVSCPGLRIGPNRLYRLAPSVRPGRNASLSPLDDDPMINDPGKHSVKVGKRAVSLRARECALWGVNPANAQRGAAFLHLVAQPDAKPVPTFAGCAP